MKLLYTEYWYTQCSSKNTRTRVWYMREKYEDGTYIVERLNKQTMNLEDVRRSFDREGEMMV